MRTHNNLYKDLEYINCIQLEHIHLRTNPCVKLVFVCLYTDIGCLFELKRLFGRSEGSSKVSLRYNVGLSMMSQKKVNLCWLR